MRLFRLSLSFLFILSLGTTSRSASPAESEAMSADEQTLKAVGIASTGPS
jgi:hypothetical protein